MTLTSNTEILDLARDIAFGVVAENAEAVDRDAAWPAGSIRALQDAGLGGLVAPVGAGGLGFGLRAVAEVCEILGQVCASSALCFGMHCVGTAVIAAKATPVQQREYLEPISAGEHITTLALSEPGSGVHFYLPQTKLEDAENGHFRVTGQKSFVTNGGFADSYVVSTVGADPDAAPDEFSCIVVPNGTPDIIWGDAWSGLGMRGNASRSMQLDGALIPQENLLGAEGDQLWYIFEVVTPYFLMAMAGTYLGVATGALDTVRTHLMRRRYSFSGSTLAQQQMIQHRVGSLWAQVQRTRMLIYAAAEEADRNSEDSILKLFAAKAEAADCAVSVANDAMTLAGGSAYLEGSTLARHLRDARASHVMAPTTDLLKTWTGRALLGLPLISE